MTLREKIAREIAKGRGGSGDLWPRYADVADAILTIPEIAEGQALKLKLDARRRTVMLERESGAITRPSR